MPVGTKGIVKTLTPDELESLGAQIMLANTYHLSIRPGADLIAEKGGLHSWINWHKPLITDSGGFQIFSLAKLRKITDQGVNFQSHLDGQKILLTPENVIKIQEQLGADIIMPLDECIPSDSEKSYAKIALKRTHDWLERSFKSKKRSDQALFPIIQGCLYHDLRKESARLCLEKNPDGIAIGGLAVGETKSEMYQILETVAPLLPENKPHYLMGVGNPEDILEAVERGMDMFDCVQPTRLARHGSIWTNQGKINLKNKAYYSDSRPLEENCNCYTCQKFSRSYLRHLLVEKEITALRLLTIHNLHFLLNLMRSIRESIQQKSFQQFKKKFLENYLP